MLKGVLMMTKIEMIEKDFEPVTAELAAFARTFDEEYSVQLGADFEAVDDEMIVYAIAMSDEGATTFRADFIRRFPACADFDIFTLSFMHELGHLETAWDMVDDVKQREAIHAMTDKVKAYRRYYALHNERIATDWAGDYLTEHHETMKAWEEKILRILKKVLDKYPD